MTTYWWTRQGTVAVEGRAEWRKWNEIIVPKDLD